MPDPDDQYGVFFEGDGRIDGVKGYLLGVFAAALICAVVTHLVSDKGTIGGAVKLITGLFLAFTVIRPVGDISLSELSSWTSDFSDSAGLAASAGEDRTREAIAAGIKTKTQAYILDKAMALDLQIQVEVVLSEEDIPIPEAVRLSGNASPYARAKLQQIIEEDLGIDKEHQIWT